MTEEQKTELQAQLDDVLAAGLSLQQERDQYRAEARTLRAALTEAAAALREYAAGKTWPHIAANALQIVGDITEGVA